jgi:hypothetical protein
MTDPIERYRFDCSGHLSGASIPAHTIGTSSNRKTIRADFREINRPADCLGSVGSEKHQTGKTTPDVDYFLSSGDCGARLLNEASV